MSEDYQDAIMRHHEAAWAREDARIKALAADCEPCPQCGKQPSVLTDEDALFFVQCEKCGCRDRRPDTLPDNTAEEAVSAWALFVKLPRVALIPSRKQFQPQPFGTAA